MSRIQNEAHQTALQLHEAGFIDYARMREFDRLCTQQPDAPPDRKTNETPGKSRKKKIS